MEVWKYSFEIAWNWLSFLKSLLEIGIWWEGAVTLSSCFFSFLLLPVYRTCYQISAAQGGKCKISAAVLQGYSSPFLIVSMVLQI